MAKTKYEDFTPGKEITLYDAQGEETNVLVVENRQKAVKVKGNISQAWFPKAAISENGEIAKWFTLTMSDCFLWDTPYNKERLIHND